ncbi:MAG TPA: pectate lyase [Candidatus Hydrogenedentes bacterium]|nr:pectate lyase [Candidatus Hydrogenedentota bacterium]
MRVTFSGFVCFGLLLVARGAFADNSPTLAFPGAEGYGRFAEGGRGGDVYHVTNLEDAGPGSLRDGIETATGPRTIVFDVSGTIGLKSRLVVEKPHLTIAGQTAPGDGITLKDYNLHLRKTSHIIVRYLRVRLGDENKSDDDAPDCITADYCDNLILDHVSASWSIDGIHDTRGCKNYTLQWSILSEALHDSVHPEGGHAMCASFRAPLSNMTIHHNIFATSRDRHPTIGGSVQEPQWIIDFRNNVIYNWSGAANVCDNQVNLVNNYFRPGPLTDPKRGPVAMKANLPDTARGHMSGNVFEGNDGWTNDNYSAMDFETWLKRPDTGYKYAGTVNDWKVETPYELGENTPATQSAKDAYELVLARAGASLRRDAVDLRVIDDIRSRRGKLLNSQRDVGGWPVLESLPAPKDTDRDGMPDAWERSEQLDPANPEDRNVVSGGYTNLERYLYSLCP